MKIGRGWAVQSFLVCFLFNAALAGLIFLMAGKIMEGLSEWVSPFLKPGGPSLPDDLRSALNSLGIFLTQLQQYLAPALAAITFAGTFLMWFSVFLLGRRQIKRAAAAAVSTAPVQKTESEAQDSIQG